MLAYDTVTLIIFHEALKQRNVLDNPMIKILSLINETKTMSQASCCVQVTGSEAETTNYGISHVNPTVLSSIFENLLSIDCTERLVSMLPSKKPIPRLDRILLTANPTRGVIFIICPLNKTID
uniref:Uncharacterized protein n=1 Tax=Romanomermis culicivorax TaxID=13658 RepID=A0A915HQG9_ROMCU